LRQCVERHRHARTRQNDVIGDAESDQYAEGCRRSRAPPRHGASRSIVHASIARR
jgi:hypothetical protein